MSPNLGVIQKQKVEINYNSVHRARWTLNKTVGQRNIFEGEGAWSSYPPDPQLDIYKYTPGGFLLIKTN